jgi:hypothetical protein
MLSIKIFLFGLAAASASLSVAMIVAVLYSRIVPSYSRVNDRFDVITITVSTFLACFLFLIVFRFF